MTKEITGRLKSIFGIHNKTVLKLHQQLDTLLETISNQQGKTIPVANIRPEDLHQIVTELFITDYFPTVSKNIHADKNNATIIMGGTAFNMNIPTKMGFLKVDTDDIDLKIYTTDINYLEKNTKALNRVLSVFRFTLIIMCFYLKQIMHHIHTYFDTLPLLEISSKSKLSTKSKTKTKSKGSNKTKKNVASGGGDNKSLNKKMYSSNIGKLNDYVIQLILKKKEPGKINQVSDTLELATMSYNEIFDTIMKKIDDAEYTITNKVGYNMKYGKITKPGIFRKLTFSDCKVIYPSLDNPGFFSYYYMNHSSSAMKQQPTIERLVGDKLAIDNIMNIKSCGNNCRYLGIDGLMIDTVYMLSFADILLIEDLEANPDSEVLVLVGYLYKYYKYLIKYLRLFVMKKYYNGTLRKPFQESAKKLWLYASTNLKRNTSPLSEREPINIQFKKILKNFHVALFHRKSLLRFYPELEEVITAYHKFIEHINASRLLFKQLDDNSEKKGQTIESITIQQADQASHSKAQAMQDGGARDKKRKSSIVKMYENYPYDDIELDNPQKKTMQLNANTKVILDKIDKMFKKEVKLLDNLKVPARG
jgi:hypothetical protein